MEITIVKHVIEIVVDKVGGHLPSVCAQCMLYHLTQHTLYTSNEKFITIVDKFKEAETMEQIHHIIHILQEWAEHNDVLINITF